MLRTPRPIIAALLLAGALTFTGCAAPAVEPEATATAETAIAATDIETIDDGIAWARALDGTATADELSEGITRLSRIIPDLDIWFQDNNAIGSDLINLNADVLSDPATAGTKVADLQAIVDDIEAAIAKGNTP